MEGDREEGREGQIMSSLTNLGTLTEIQTRHGVRISVLGVADRRDSITGGTARVGTVWYLI
ncbi:hypothetical protein CIB48_g10798, partial [Xylaria polymorpha]